MGPACETCGKTTRLVGVELHEDDPDIEVRTFNCDGCGDYIAVEAKPEVSRVAIVPE